MKGCGHRCRYEIIVYDEKGRRLFTDWTPIKPDKDILQLYIKKAQLRKGRKACSAVALERIEEVEE